MAQVIDELVLKVREQGLAGVNSSLEKLDANLKQMNTAAERTQKALGAGMAQAAQQVQGSLSRLSAEAAKVQKATAGMAAGLRAANDNLTRATPSFSRLSASVGTTSQSLGDLQSGLSRMSGVVAQTEAATEEMVKSLQSAKTSADRLDKSIDQLSAGMNQEAAAARRAANATKNMGNASASSSGAVFTLTARLAALAAGYVSVTTASSLAQRAISNSRALANLSAQTGIATEKLAGLQSVVASVGVELTTLTDAAIEYGRRVREGLADPTSEAGQALRELGIEVQNADGSIRSFSDVLPDMADRFAGWQDGAEKTAVAMAILGEQGRRLIPVLNKGGEEIRKSTEKVRGLNLAIDPQVLRDFDKATQDLSDTLGSMLADAIEEVLPLLARLYSSVNSILGILRNMDSEGARKSRLIQNMESLTIQLRIAEGELEKLTARQSQLKEALDTRTGPALERAREELKKVEDQIAAVSAQIDLLNQKKIMIEMPEQVPLPILDPRPDKGADKPGRITTRGTGGLSAVEEMAQAAQQKAMQDAIDIAMQQTGLLENLILTYGDYASAVEEAEKRIREAHKHTWEAEMQIAEMRKNLQRQQQQALLDTVQMAGQALTALFPKSKAAAIAEAVMNTAVGVTRALRDVPWPLNWIQAGLVAAAGAAQIAAIRSTNMSGGGGFPRVGGTGAAAAPSTAQTAPPGRAVHIHIPAGDFFSREAVVGLIERLNEEVQNGATLISTRTIPL